VTDANVVLGRIAADRPLGGGLLKALDAKSAEKAIHEYVAENGKLLLFLGEGQHKIKRKAEQIACNEAIKSIPENASDEVANLLE
jgi:N-methylhydantoinase A/oxoprolinase/acetone carboxylase beta subunit